MNKIMNMVGSVNEKEIIKKIVNGETILFEILVRRYNGVLYKIAKMYGFSSGDSEDIVQEAHIAAFIDLKNFEQRASYKTWISKIMINKCLYKAKHSVAKKEVSVSEFMDESRGPLYSSKVESEKKLQNQELSRILEVCVQRLPLSYRMVFVLREVEGYSINDTATLLEISPANVKVRLSRAKVLLRKEIEKFYSPADLFDIKLADCDNIVKAVLNRIAFQIEATTKHLSN